MADAVLAALLAPPCAVCARVLDAPLAGAVCPACWSAIVPAGSLFSTDTIVRARALGPYDGTLREMLHALKYDGRRSIAPPLSRMMREHGADILEDADVVVPVPLHRRRQRERGFNQAEDLASGLGRPVLRALSRVRPTTPQVDLSREQRVGNVAGAFAIRGGNRTPFRLFDQNDSPEQRPLQGQIVVLVDDVATTGATLEACARLLKRAGAVDVLALTAARAVNALRS